MPAGFKQYNKSGWTMVMKMKQTLYGLCQSPRVCWKYATDKLVKCGMVQLDLDPCLFTSDKVIYMVHINDLLFMLADRQHIYEMAEKLQADDVLLDEEGDPAGLLEVKLTCLDDDRISMIQYGLIDHIVTAFGLNSDGPIVKNTNGAFCKESFNYASVIGMLLYLTDHSRPCIYYTLNCAARYTFQSHEVALKRIGWYVKLTRDKILILKPTKGLNVDEYQEAHFPELYRYCSNLYANLLAVQAANRDSFVNYGGRGAGV
ncbi:hypothetical protein ACHAXS_006386 [Conticribra weissflogii]